MYIHQNDAVCICIFMYIQTLHVRTNPLRYSVSNSIPNKFNSMPNISHMSIALSTLKTWIHRLFACGVKYIPILSVMYILSNFAEYVRRLTQCTSPLFLKWNRGRKKSWSHLPNYPQHLPINVFCVYCWYIVWQDVLCCIIREIRFHSWK